MPELSLEDLDFELPPGRVARHPCPERSDARLLVCERACAQSEASADATVGREPRLARIRDLPSLLARPALWVFNESRVMPARLRATRPSGGQVEVLLASPLSRATGERRWTALVRGMARLRVGERLHLSDTDAVTFIGRDDASPDQGVVELPVDYAGVMRWLEKVGTVPLPPYLERSAEPADAERYQTVYASNPGSVAAPTAGLHFTPEVLNELEAQGHQLAFLTLHVGPGTFKPLGEEGASHTLASERLHREHFFISPRIAAAVSTARSQGMPVVAVGTTSLRALESAWVGSRGAGSLREGPGETALFVKPGYAFKVVDGLLTNFHLPRTSLLALVMAHLGVAATRRAYAFAIEKGLRFYSYGDAMVSLPTGLLREPEASQ